MQDYEKLKSYVERADEFFWNLTKERISGEIKSFTKIANNYTKRLCDFYWNLTVEIDLKLTCTKDC